MVNTDHVQTGTTAHAGAVTGGTEADTVAKTHDANNNTYYGVSDTGNNPVGGGITSNVTLYSEHTFAAAQDLTMVKFKPYAYAGTDTYSLAYNKWVQCYFKVFNGTWTTVWDYDDSETGSGAITYDPGVISVGGKWEDVTKVRLEIEASATADNDSDAKARSYEDQAWGMVPEPDNEKCYSGVI